MVNYIYNVRLKDKFRLKIIPAQERSDGGGVSITDVVSAYFIDKPKGAKIDYDLVLVDTPGFRGTRGMEEVLENIRAVLENVLDSIDAICFVVKATQTRLSVSQNCVFDSMLNLFGKDIKKKLFILMTFADAQGM